MQLDPLRVFRQAMLFLFLCAAAFALINYSVAHFTPGDGQIWAAWVQAFGALGAIGAAYWIAHGEARDRRERDKRDDARVAREQRAFLKSASVLLDETASLVDDAIRSMSAFSHHGRSKLDDRMESFAAQLASFPVERLEDERAIELMIRVRSRLLDVRTMLKQPLASEYAQLAAIQAHIRTSAKVMARIAGTAKDRSAA